MEEVMTGAGVTNNCASGVETFRGVSRRNNHLIAAASWLLGVVILLESDPAWAQITKVNTVTQNVQTVLTSVAVTLFTVAIMWAGFKMARPEAGLIIRPLHKSLPPSALDQNILSSPLQCRAASGYFVQNLRLWVLATITFSALYIGRFQISFCLRHDIQPPGTRDHSG